VKAVIPFAGFYESVHSSNLDYAAEQLVQDDRGDVRDGLTLDASYTGPLLNAYCREYTEQWSKAAGIACTYESLSSPREYNFTTDRIFVDIEESEVSRLFASVDKSVLTHVCRGMFTSRSGFLSYYSPDWQTWGAVADWDHNQVSALIRASIPEDMPGEYELVDDCNGFVSGIVWKNLSDEDKRVVRIADYLRAREERKYGPVRVTAYGVLSVPASLMRMAELNGQLTLNFGG
jgi:hypothetical protein